MCLRYTFSKSHLTLLLEGGTAKDYIIPVCPSSTNRFWSFFFFFNVSASCFECDFGSCCWLLRMELYFSPLLSEVFCFSHTSSFAWFLMIKIVTTLKKIKIKILKKSCCQFFLLQNLTRLPVLTLSWRTGPLINKTYNKKGNTKQIILWNASSHD